jgi:pimeloyl-ACP methyl ester carboxylesterase
VSTKIAFREYGEPNDSSSGKPVVVLLHGYAGTVRHWDTVVESLQQQHRVAVPNLTHLTLSTEKMPFGAQVDQIARFCKVNFQDQPLVLCGISYGAALCWGVAIKYPELAQKLILINPMPPDPQRFFQISILRQVMKLPLNVRSLYLILRSDLGRFFLRKVAELFRVERAQWFDHMDNLYGRKLLFVAHVIEKFSWILRNEDWSYWKSKMKSWSIPTQMIFDPDDPLFRKSTYLKFAHHLDADEIHELPRSGHIAIHYRGPSIAKLISQFVSGKSSEKRAG